MTNMEFGENTQMNAFRQKVLTGESDMSGIIGFMIKKGIVKSRQSAYVILLIVTAVCFGLAIMIPVLSGPKKSPVPDEEAMRVMQESFINAQKNTPQQSQQ